jgi:fumarate reductase flavoprotein subunit
MKFGLSLFLIFFLASPLLAQTVKPPTADRHKAKGIDCVSCHGTGEKKPVTGEVCLSCHKSYEEVAKRTTALGPNPHSNHFIETNVVDCTSCHHGHKPSSITCELCHDGIAFDHRPVPLPK